MTLGERIKNIRKSKGITQQQLAKSCNFALVTIRQYESGARTPRIEQLKIIANALDVELYDLISDAPVGSTGFRVIDLFAGVGGTAAHYVSPDKSGETEIFSAINPFPAEITAFCQFIRLLGYEISAEDDRFFLNYRKSKVEIPVEELTRLLRASEATVGALVHDLFNRFKDKAPE